MNRHQIVIAALLSLVAPLAAADEATDKSTVGATAPAQVAAGEASQQPKLAAPVAEPPAAAAAPSKAPAVTWDVGGWLVTSAWATSGAVNSSELPRFALPDKSERATGISVRQSRLRTTIGVPNEVGLLGGALLKGFVEIDFAGGYAGADESQPLLRLRHAYVTSTWKDLGNLTLLVGQTTDIFHGSVGAASVAHVATPRFSGAGYLHRRAPQVRLQGELGGALALGWQIGVLSPADKTTQTASATSVGYRSGQPDLEARLAFLLRGSSPVKVELGVGGHSGQEKWLLPGAPDSPDEKVKSRAVAADLRVEASIVTLVGGAFAGENLDVASSLAPGVRTTAADGKLTSVRSVPTRGAWGQLQVRPVKALQLLVGAGVETPRKPLLPATLSVGSTTFPSVDRNLQLSAGTIVDLTTRWRAGLEYTRYQSHGIDGTTSRSGQVELSTLLAL